MTNAYTNSELMLSCVTTLRMAAANSGASGKISGYAIGAGTVSNFSINQYLYKSVPYDIERDLQGQPGHYQQQPNAGDLR